MRYARCMDTTTEGEIVSAETDIYAAIIERKDAEISALRAELAALGKPPVYIYPKLVTIPRALVGEAEPDGAISRP